MLYFLCPALPAQEAARVHPAHLPQGQRTEVQNRGGLGKSKSGQSPTCVKKWPRGESPTTQRPLHPKAPERAQIKDQFISFTAVRKICNDEWVRSYKTLPRRWGLTLIRTFLLELVEEDTLLDSLTCGSLNINTCNRSEWCLPGKNLWQLLHWGGEGDRAPWQPRILC